MMRALCLDAGPKSECCEDRQGMAEADVSAFAEEREMTNSFAALWCLMTGLA